MELTGQAKIDFQKWLPQYIQVIIVGFDGKFETLPDSMKYGVYVDWFLLALNKDLDKSTVYFTKGWGKKKARTKATQELCKIYNNLNK